MTATAFINVVARHVFLASLPWVEELNKLGLVILTYCGASVALKEALTSDCLCLRIICPKMQDIVFILSCICGIFFCIIAIKYGYKMAADEFLHNVRTQGMQWPEYLYAMWLPIGCFILAIRFMQLIVKRAKKLMGKEISEK